MTHLLNGSIGIARLRQWRQWLFIYSSYLTGLLGSGQVLAQQLDTQPLAVTSVCAGAAIDVKGIKSSGGISFTVELSDGGGTYTEIPSTLIESSGRYEFTCRATIPASTPAGNNYRIRIVSRNPDLIGVPSTSVLTVKANPAPPTVESIQFDCQRRTANDAFTNVYVKILSGASAKIYDAHSKLLQDGSQLSVDQTTVYFALSKSLAAADNGFQYPISETTYNVSQVVDGCESENVSTLLRMLYRPDSGPVPANQVAAGFGKLTYCQGDKAVPLNVNGHSAPPENYLTVYSLDGPKPTPTTIPPLPDTSVPGSQTYRLGLVPIDPKKGCPSAPNASGPSLKIDILARPTATLTGNQTIDEGQPAMLSVAFTGDSPWKFSYYDSTATGAGSPKTVSTSTNPYVFEARPAKTTSYLLTGISNGCGDGTIIRQLAVVNLVPLLGVDDQSLTSNVTVYPVPATTTLTVQINGLSIAEPALLEVTDVTGQFVSRQQTRQAVSSLTLDHYPVGTYVLRIKVGDRTASKRIVKF